MSGTNLGKMPILIVSLVIGIVMATTAIVPLVSDYAEAKTFTNDGYFRMDHFDDTTDHIVTWSYEHPSTITVDGEDVQISYAKNANITIIADTNFLLRYYTDGSGNGRALAYIPSSGSRVDALADQNHTLTVNLTSGSMTGTIAGTSISSTYTDVYIPSNDGEFVMKKSDKSAYINGDSAIFGFGLTLLNTHAGTVQTSPGTGFRFEGNYDDGVLCTVWKGSDVTVDDIVINATEEAGYTDLYSFESITAVATLTESANTTDTDLTYSYVIVPYEVTADPDNPAAYKALVKVVPVMAFVALIAAAAFMIYSKRD